MGQKPDDWWIISLCHECHSRQHQIGETYFSAEANINMRALAEAFAKASPRAAQIRAEKASR